MVQNLSLEAWLTPLCQPVAWLGAPKAGWITMPSVGMMSASVTGSPSAVPVSQSPEIMAAVTPQPGGATIDGVTRNSEMNFVIFGGHSCAVAHLPTPKTTAKAPKMANLFRCMGQQPF